MDYVHVEECKGREALWVDGATDDTADTDKVFATWELFWGREISFKFSDALASTSQHATDYYDLSDVLREKQQENMNTFNDYAT